MNDVVDSLRAATLGRNPQFKSVSVTYTEDGQKPVTVSVKQPTVKQRNDMVKRCRNNDGGVDETEFLVQSVIALVVDPEGGKPLYKQTDRAALLEQPSGGFVDVFGTAAVKLLSLEGQEKNLTSSS